MAALRSPVLETTPLLSNATAAVVLRGNMCVAKQRTPALPFDLHRAAMCVGCALENRARLRTQAMIHLGFLSVLIAARVMAASEWI